MASKKTDRVATASRRYQRALEAHTSAINSGDEEEIERTLTELNVARKRLESLTGEVKPLIGAAAGAAAGAALGALGGPGLAAAGGAVGALVVGTLASPGAIKATGRVEARRPSVGRPSFAKEVQQLKKKLLE